MKILTGKVVSIQMLKTIIVEVSRQRIHPLYKKIIRREKRYKVHNPDIKLQVGDFVKIIQTRPISKYKHYKVFSKL